MIADVRPVQGLASEGGEKMPAICKRMPCLLVKMIFAATITASLTGVTQAYDRGDCDRIFGGIPANVARAQQFSMEGGLVDFGDELHLFGTPLGTAVACFATDGRIVVKGRLYADNIRGEVRIRFRRTNGQVTAETLRFIDEAGFAHREFIVTSPAGNFNRVRVRLHTFHRPSGVRAQTAIRNIDR